MATSYANNGGTGDRRVEIKLSTNIVCSNTDIGTGNTIDDINGLGFFDGDTTTNARQPANQPNNPNDRWFKFDWGKGAEAKVVIDEFKWYMSNADTTFALATYTFEGSDDDSSWTTIGASFNLATSATTTIARTNSTGYRYYRIHTTAFNGNGGSGEWLREIEFKIEYLTPTTVPSVFSTGGKGNRSSVITATTDVSLSSGTIGTIVDGDYTDNSSHAIALNAGTTAGHFLFDFGAGASGVITCVALRSPLAAGNTHGTWKLQGSNDNSAFTDIGSTFSLFTASVAGGSVYAKHHFENATAWRYYRITQTAGSTANNPDIVEVEFKLKYNAAVTVKFPFRVLIAG